MTALTIFQVWFKESLLANFIPLAQGMPLSPTMPLPRRYLSLLPFLLHHSLDVSWKSPLHALHCRSRVAAAKMTHFPTLSSLLLLALLAPPSLQQGEPDEGVLAAQGEFPYAVSKMRSLNNIIYVILEYGN